MLKHIAFVCAVALAGVVLADDLENGFKSPPDSAKPRTWWHWVSGNVSREGITKDLEAMKAIGVGGAQCFSVDQADKKFHGKVLYGSPEWLELTQHAIRECNRLGLELTMHACEGWSESGGNWIKPEQSMQKVVWSEKVVSGPAKIATPLPAPEKVQDFYRDIAVFAFPAMPGDATATTMPATTQATTKRANRKTPKPASAPGRIADLVGKSGMESRVLGDTPPTTQVSDENIIKPAKLIELTNKFDDKGALSWDVPEGEWTILRVGHTSTGAQNAPAMSQTRGLECDKLSRDAVKTFFDGMLAKVIQHAGPLAGHGLDFVLMDSWEARCQNWTPKFREEFQKRRGYDPLPWMPAVCGRYVESPEKTERFLWDYRRTIADLIAENHHGYTRDLLHERGMKLTSEAVGIGMPVVADQLQCKGRTDVPMGEFWVGQVNDNGDPKEAAAGAHIYGAKYVAAESFTAAPEHAGWKNDPASLKQQGDLMFTVGINRYVFHRYAHQPEDRKPGITMGPWGINFERSNTWWEPGKAWIDYISRCQFMLQEGLFVADILYYYGEGAPREVRPSALNPKPPTGYDYDVCNAEVLLTRLSVKDGRIVLPDGMSYRVLVLPHTDRMSPAVLAKVRDLVEEGATVIGPKPVAAPGLSNFPSADQQVKVIANRLWGDCNGTSVVQHNFGAGRICWGKPMVQVLAGTSPDFEATPASEGAEIRYIHRRTADADFYFVSNQGPRYETVDCTFRVDGKLPEFWHADTGEIEPVAMYRMNEGRTTVTLQLEPSGSVFVVFRKPMDRPLRFASLTRAGYRITREQPPPASLKVTKAVYGVLDDKAKQVDVTEKVAAMVNSNRLRVHADNELARDPAVNVHKQFRLEYALDGKPMSMVVHEGDNIEIPDSIHTYTPLAAELKGDHLIAWENGAYDLASISAHLQRVYVDDVPAAVEIGGAWEVHFPPNWGAPESVDFEKLMSWTESSDDGVKHFSGTATYVKDFDLPGEIVAKGNRVQLDLGSVKNLAEVKLNGKSLGVLWKPPFAVDITGAAKRGHNRLEVAVTNLWPNRLIGDKSLPEGKRFTWATFDPYKADSPLLPSGLLGPVKVRAAKVIAIEPQ